MSWTNLTSLHKCFVSDYVCQWLPWEMKWYSKKLEPTSLSLSSTNWPSPRSLHIFPYTRIQNLHASINVFDTIISEEIPKKKMKLWERISSTKICINSEVDSVVICCAWIKEPVQSVPQNNSWTRPDMLKLKYMSYWILSPDQFWSGYGTVDVLSVKGSTNHRNNWQPLGDSVQFKAFRHVPVPFPLRALRGVHWRNQVLI